MLALVSEEMIDAGLQHYSEGGCSGLADYERREVVKDILTAGIEVFGAITPDERSEYWKGSYERMAARSVEDAEKIEGARAAASEEAVKAIMAVCASQDAEWKTHVALQCAQAVRKALEDKP